MRPVKMLTIAVALASIAIGVVGVASASAVTLCEENKNECPVGKRYAVGQEIEAKLEAGVPAEFKTSSGWEIKCKEGTLVGKTTENKGPKEVLFGEITAMTFAQCEGCTGAAESLNKPYLAEMLWDPFVLGDGTWNLSSSGKGKPSIKFTGCPFGTTCTFGETAIVLTILGGNPAKIVALKAPLTREAGHALCGAKAEWIAAVYEVTKPKPVWVQAEP